MIPMAGEIKHTWVGTTLIIESDSGTSAMDLKGATGDTGPRGPQGPAGVVFDDSGDVSMEGYATEQYVQDMLENVDVDLTGYATETYVNQKITEAKLEGSGSGSGPVDLSGYATKDYVDEKIEAIDIPNSVDLTNYATKDYVTQKVAEAQIEGAEIDLSNYVTQKQLQDALNGIPDVSEVAY